MKVTDNLAIARAATITTLTPTSTASRAIALPDKAGTVALLSDIPVNPPRPYVEVLTITATNTLPNLTNTPTAIANYPVSLTVNGERRYSIGQAAFSVAGKVLTWNAAIAGYSLQAGSDVIAEYYF